MSSLPFIDPCNMAGPFNVKTETEDDKIIIKISSEWIESIGRVPEFSLWLYHDGLFLVSNEDCA